MIVSMKKTLILLALLGMTQTYAQVDHDCLKEAQAKKTLSDCLKKKVKDKKGPQVHHSKKGDVTALSKAVILKRNDSGQAHILTGDQTQLKNPIATFWDEENQEILVVEENGEILIYTDFLLGNVAPKRKVVNHELSGAKDIVVTKKGLIVLNPLTQRILVFDKLANSRALPGKRNDEVKRVIDLPSQGKFIAIAALGDDSFLILSDKGNVLRLGPTGPVQVAKVQGAYDLSYSEEGDQKSLIVQTPEGPQTITLP